MARPLRMEYQGALYHVTSRGNRRQAIFFSDTDRKKFLRILQAVSRTYRWLVHAFCLMNNHYHLLVETPDGNLAAGMRDLNGIYTQWHNNVHQVVGHLFQGRYKAFVVEKESYFLEVARYVVLNPVRANLVKHPREWVWSSYLATSGEGRAQPGLDTKRLLRLFSPRAGEARRRWRIFVEEGMGTASPFAKAQHGTILGSPQFVSEKWEQNKEAESKAEIVKNERMINRPSLDELFCSTETTRKRNAAIKQARIRCGYSVTDIARHLFIHRTTVSRILNEC